MTQAPQLELPERPAVEPASVLRVLTMRPFPLFFVCLLLVVSSVAWRRGAFYSGGLDVVVVAKAALTVLAVVIALLMRRPPGAWGRMAAAPVLWLGSYLLISVIGGILNADGLPTIVLAGRLALLAFALVLVTVSHPWHVVLSAMSSAMLLLACFGALTGLGSLATTGRLYGGIPPLNANEICLLVSVPVVILFWKAVHGTASRAEFYGLLPLLGLIWLTGSRTGLAGLIFIMVLLVVVAPRVPPRVVAGIAATVPMALAVAFLTPLVTAFAGRGDLESVTTLNNRTVAWRAALDYADTPSVQLFGSGLALKQIPVTALYRDQQMLDSSWVSALIQAGYVGSMILLLFVLATLVRALRLPRPQRSLVGGLALLVTLVGVLESGMFDTAPAFIVFFTMSMLAHRIIARPRT
ncbi:hypothetical protein GCM10009790_07100 [Georgenia ruanii]